ncbi:MAG: N-formylglutamate amidohydrolase [Chitinispirillaceae bacterium]|nr:N-formylglutamate amidohydrolase [Chitinispirillaceae bacterium]
MSSAAILITCEHAGNLVPADFRHLFENDRKILSTHEAYDAHALTLARRLARKLNAPLFFARETRLLIDQNRSIFNRNLFSRYSRALSQKEKDRMVATLYAPYREKIIGHIERTQEQERPVFHFAIHTFTPVLHNKARTADIGLLFDPSSNLEASVCACIRDALLLSMPQLCVRRNYPYRGTNDGLTSALRARFKTSFYAGIEIEVNQKMADAASRKQVGQNLSNAISLAVTT